MLSCDFTIFQLAKISLTNPILIQYNDIAHMCPYLNLPHFYNILFPYPIAVSIAVNSDKANMSNIAEIAVGSVTAAVTLLLTAIIITSIIAVYIRTRKQQRKKATSNSWPMRYCNSIRHVKEFVVM